MRVAPLVLLVLACCLKPPSPAQQAQDFANAEACVADHWGEPPEAVASVCFSGELQATLDVIADIEALFAKRGVVDAYAANPEVQARMAKRSANEGGAR